MIFVNDFATLKSKRKFFAKARYIVNTSN